MFRCWIATILFLTIFSAGLSPQEKGQNEKPAEKDDFQKRVDAAIDRGAEFIRTHYGERFALHSVPNQSHIPLQLYALTHAGRKQDKDFVTKELAKRSPARRTYEDTLLAMTLAIHSKAKHRSVMATLAKLFLEGQNDIGGWGYGLDKPIAEMSIGYDNLSTSQFGVFGLHACWRYLAPEKPKDGKLPQVQQIPNAVWEKIAKYWLDAQRGDGGWCYLHPDIRLGVGGIYNSSYHSMTCAGISSLAVARVHVKPDSQ